MAEQHAVHHCQKNQTLFFSSTPSPTDIQIANTNYWKKHYLTQKLASHHHINCFSQLPEKGKTMVLFLENLIKSFFVGTVFFLGVFLTGLALADDPGLPLDDKCKNIYNQNGILIDCGPNNCTPPRTKCDFVPTFATCGCQFP